MSTKAFQARETIKNEKRSGTLINAAGRDATKSAIFLDNGSVVASSYDVNTLLKLIGKSTNRSPDRRVKETEHLKIYEAVMEPGEDCKEEEPDIDSIMESIDEEENSKEDNDENYTSDSEDAD